MKHVVLAILSSCLLVACEGSSSDRPVDTPDVPAAPLDADASEADAAPGPLEITAADFPCLTELATVRRFRVGNLLGDLDASLAVASSSSGGTYPPGTLLQLVPFEAMVKRHPGWSRESGDWEFFSLDASGDATVILDRGTTDVVNQFGGNCLDCHAKAEPQWDFVCESGHGCDDLPIGPKLIRDLQEADPRCP
ncbi:MAG: hypothetical protein ACQEXJ_16760 [Myxococcota bacterium]